MSDPTAWEQLVAAHHLAAHAAQPTEPPHEPVAAVLACSDARLPPSVIFDQPAGRLFVVRVAGNTAGPAALASLDFAVAELGVELLIVLGHTHCGAVQAATSGGEPTYLAPIVDPISEVARSVPDAPADRIVHHNVATTVDLLWRHGGPLGIAARCGKLEIRGAVHDLLTGRLEPVGPLSAMQHKNAIQKPNTTVEAP